MLLTSSPSGARRFLGGGAPRPCPSSSESEEESESEVDTALQRLSLGTAVRRERLTIMSGLENPNFGEEEGEREKP